MSLINEQIKKLAKQAITEELTLDEFINDLKLNPIKYWGFTDAELEKFVELIVRECCKEITQEPFNAGAASLWLKEHFGIKE